MILDYDVSQLFSGLERKQLYNRKCESDVFF